MSLRVEECRRLLEPRNIFELLPREVFEGLVRGIHQHYRKGVALLWAEYDEQQDKWVVKKKNRIDPHKLVADERPRDFSIFCWELRKIVGLERCLKYDRHIAQEYVDGERVEHGTYKCWAKLDELAYPLQYGGKVRAVLLAGGQIIPIDQKERDKIRQAIISYENGAADWEKVRPYLEKEIKRQTENAKEESLESLQKSLMSLGAGLQGVINRAYENRLDRAMRLVQKDLQEIFTRADLSRRDSWWQDVKAIFPDFCNAIGLDKIFVLSFRKDHYEQMSNTKEGEVEIGRIALKEAAKIGEKSRLVNINNEHFGISKMNYLTKSGDCWAYRTELKEDVINVSTLLIVKGIITEINQSIVEDFCRIVTGLMDMASMIFQIQESKQHREKALGRMTHELKVPLVAIRGAIEFIERTPGVKDLLDYDYPGDIWSWTDLMGRIIGNADVFRYATTGIQIKPVHTLILGDVIAPAIKQVSLLLGERGFSFKNIRYDNETFKRFPKLWLDQNYFQQVFFNLLSNSIKYAFDNPDSFKVEIDGDFRGEIIIWFRDWGPGIEIDMEEKIFEEDVRGKSAVDMYIAGQGLGLWIVRQLMERHGGTIKVTNTQFPTEFCIRLPESLKWRPPEKIIGE